MSKRSQEIKKIRGMNVSRYEVNDVLSALRSRYKYAIFTIGEPNLFPNSFPLDMMKIYKLVGIYISIPDVKKFLVEDHPEGQMEDDGFHLLIDAKTPQD